MFWSLDLDDFHGKYCNKGPYPLLTAIYNAIDSGDPTKITTTSGPSTTPIDFNLHHRTNKNGVNVYDMLNSGERLQCYKTLISYCLFAAFWFLKLI